MYQEQTIEQNIQGHGRNLMGAALVAMAIVGAYQLWIMTLPWLWPERMATAYLLRQYELVIPDPASLSAGYRAILTLSTAVSALAPLLPLWMLYRLGRCLARENALNTQTADAIRQLAHSLLISTLVLPFLAIGISSLLVLASVYSSGDITYRDSGIMSGLMPFGEFLAGVGTGILVLFVACTCLYSLAWLIQVGAEAADDSRSIV